MISIIIPTLNEEEYLPLLLTSIKKQDFSDYEIIIADADSKDGTLGVAKANKLKVVPGGLPAKGKNNGARKAKGDILLFLDADVVLPDNFFAKTLTELKKRNLDMGGFGLLPVKKNRLHRFLFRYFYNLPIMAMEKALPHAAAGIIIKKKIFEKINGFDERVAIAEDHDLVRRARRFGKYGIFKSTTIFASERRFERDGWAKTFFKYVFCEFHMVLRGPVKSDILKYKFGHYRDGHSG